MMKIVKLIVGPMASNCYIAWDEDTKDAVIIDPGFEDDRIMETVEKHGLKVGKILLTHGHFDHIMGIDGFCKVYDVPVYVGEKEAGLITDAHWNQSDIYTKGYTFSEAVYVQDGKILRLAGYDFQVFFTPGHTPGGVCYYVASEGILFSGDTLFHHSVGRTDFEGGSMSDLVRGIEDKLLPLPDETKVLPGHMDATTIGEEKKYNPFLRRHV